MKRFLLVSLLVGVVATAVAQDDMYYTPAKKSATTSNASTSNASTSNATTSTQSNISASGIQAERDVDEYNRRNYQSRYTEYGYDGNDDVVTIDDDATLNDDIIAFDTAEGYGDDVISIDEAEGAYILAEYDDLAYIDEQYSEEDDFAYCREMSRFDDFYWTNPWFHGWYGPYMHGWYGSHFWRTYYGLARYWGWRDPVFDPWYDPW